MEGNKQMMDIIQDLFVDIPEAKLGKKHTILQRATQIQQDMYGEYLKTATIAMIPQICFPLFAGFLGGTTALFFKCFGEVIKTRNEYPNFSHPLTYVIALIFLISIILQIYFLNKGQKYYENLQVIPIYEASIIVHNVLCGGIVLDEFSQYESFNLFMFGVGILIIVFGVLIMLSKTKSVVMFEQEGSFYIESFKLNELSISLLEC